MEKIKIIIRGIIGYLLDKTEIISNISVGIDKIEIGHSTNNEPIECYKINNGLKKVLFAAAIHGNEVGTVKLAHRIINFLVEKKDSLRQCSFFVIPCVNPDGYNIAMKEPDYFQGGRSGRFNAMGVDLNRNFDVPSFLPQSFWLSGRNYQDKEKVFCGTRGGSEPEIKAITNFIIDNNVNYCIFFHNAGKDVTGSNGPLAQDLAKRYSLRSGFRYIGNEEWKTFKQTGTAKEWCESKGIAYLEIEGSNRWGSDWKKQKEAIWDFVNHINNDL